MHKIFLFAVILFFALSLIHLIINTRIIYTGYEIDKLKNAFNKIRAENRYLSAISAKKQNLERIESEAKKIGMVAPSKVYFITAEETAKK